MCLKVMVGGGGGGPYDFIVIPSPFGLDFGTLDFGTSDLGLTIVFGSDRSPGSQEVVCACICA